jgi:hypothetical protein
VLSLQQVDALAGLNLAPSALWNAGCSGKAGPVANGGDDLFGDGLGSASLQLGGVAGDRVEG